MHKELSLEELMLANVNSSGDPAGLVGSLRMEYLQRTYGSMEVVGENGMTPFVRTLDVAACVLDIVKEHSRMQGEGNMYSRVKIAVAPMCLVPLAAFYNMQACAPHYPK